MFDLRYHVASLAAVFLALIIGMLVGAGISGRGLLDEAERDKLNGRIADLEAANKAEEQHTRELEASDALARSGYRALVANRLEGKGVALLFVGSVAKPVRSAVEDAVTRAGGSVVRMRALTAPIQTKELEAALRRRRALQGYVGVDRLDDVGHDLGVELVDGGETPLWDALSDALVEETSGDGEDAVDGVVVSRTAPPQRGQTRRFVRGLYSGLTGATEVAVGVETSTADPSAVRSYQRGGLSSVDDVDLAVGRVALAVLLAGGPPGDYGIKQTSSRYLPPIEPASAAP